jgi:uncharacterized membrane protein
MTMMGGVNAWGSGMWLAACVGMLALWVIGVMAAFTVMRQYGPRHESAMGSTSPQRILDERFACGEISEDEYLQREAMLRGSR